MSLHNPACFTSHLGVWMHEPRRFQHAVQAIRGGVIQARALEHPLHLAAAVTDLDTTPVADPRGEADALYRVADGIAMIEIHGAIMKGWSKYADASSVFVRRALRAAGADERVKEILLVIDSPGGQAAGTQALADDVASIGARKPIYAHIDDLGASAAYWVASQAREISANRTAEIGSIGTYAVVWDESQAFAADGVKVHVVSTGPYKGAFAEGAPIKPEHLAQLQREIDDLNAYFLAAVTTGRAGRMTADQVKLAADGRVWIAETAHEMGLIDAIRSLDDTIAAIRAARGGSGSSSRRRRAAVAAASSGLYSAKQIAASLDAPQHRVDYVIRSRDIQPVYRSGHIFLYSADSMNAIRREIRRIDALKDCSVR